MPQRLESFSHLTSSSLLWQIIHVSYRVPCAVQFEPRPTDGFRQLDSEARPGALAEAMERFDVASCFTWENMLTFTSLTEERDATVLWINDVIMNSILRGPVPNAHTFHRVDRNLRKKWFLSGYSAAALLAIVFAIPFGLRVLIHKEAGRWTNLTQAFYHVHLEIFLGNACLGVGVKKLLALTVERYVSPGVGVMMLLALTVERYVSVCHPGRTRPLMGSPRLTVALIPLLTFAVYLPNVFRNELQPCLLPPAGPVAYHQASNTAFLDSVLYSIYKVVLEVVFKVGPTVLLAALNLRIMVMYRRSCERRRRMTLCRSKTSDDDPRHFAEERRLILLLGSTSILFLVCVSPMVILNVTLSESNLSHFSYQVFRAVANLLEVTNYSITFYIYCLFSEDFRNTLLRTMRWPWLVDSASRPGPRAKALLELRYSTPPTTTSTTTTTACLPVPSGGSAHKLWQGLRGCAGSRGYRETRARASA